MSDGVKKPQPIRSESYYQENGIVFLGETTVTGIDYDKKNVNIQGQGHVSYDKLLIASGCVNRFPPIPGLDKTNYSSLRSLKDYEQINQAVRDGVKNVTIIGGGFIGMELASAIKAALKENINVTILEQGAVPLETIVGKDVGNVVAQLAKNSGVNLKTSIRIQKIESGENGAPQSVVLEN